MIIETLNTMSLKTVVNFLAKKSIIFENLNKLIIKNQTKCLSSATSVSDRAQFPGYKGEFSTNLDFLYPDNMAEIQCYRVMDRRGNIINETENPNVIIINPLFICQ